jgi:hypothetical protein
MFREPKLLLAAAMFAASTFVGAMPPAYAQDASWRVAKSSGDVWLTTTGNQQVALGSETMVTPGGNIRTGRNGRVLLTRGAERILISPNSEIGIPLEKKGELATTITQQAGTIVLDVEKRNVQHFEVETPYLAAVVKGTQFRVSVDKGTSRVAVLRGQVQVSDFKSGQNVLVMPGQVARTSGQAAGGLMLSGPGRLNAIEHGTPRTSSVRPLAVPATGLRPPRAAAGHDIRPLRPTNPRAVASFAREPAFTRTAKGGLHIGAPMGEVKLDFQKVTKGLAHGTDANSVQASGAKDKPGSVGADSLTGASGMKASESAALGANGNVSAGGASAGSAGGNGGAGGGGGGGGGNGAASAVASSSAGGNGNAYGLVNGVANGLGNGVGKTLGKLKLK